MSTRFIAMTGLFLAMAFSSALRSQEKTFPLVTHSGYTKPRVLVAMDHGRRMNIYCLGTGSPAVIMDAGLGGSTISWALVQPAVATKTRVCSYDRAGMGFSDEAIRPGTADNIAADLHALLKAAHVPPPYVLVGHSAAGMYIRLFADRYLDEVVGMVSVEGSHEDQSLRGWAIGLPGQKEKWDAYLKDSYECVADARRGLVPGTPDYKKCVGDADPRFSSAINDAEASYEITPKWQAAMASERESIFYASAEQTRVTRRNFGDMPIIVLTHSPYPKSADETQQERDKRTLLWESLHLELAAMSTRGVNEIVPNSGHFIQFEHPQIVIDAIDQAVEIAKEKLATKPATSKNP